MLLVCAWSLSSQVQSTRGSVDWILVLDTSASMRGVGGTPDIFARVKDSIAGFIRSTREGDSIALYTFDRDTALRSNVRITADIDKTEVLRIVEQLSADGNRTHTGKAIHDALERATELKNRKDSNREVSIVLFTDGSEDVRGIPNPITVPSNISLIPKDQPYMFFVSLGAQEHDKQVEDFVKDPAMGNRGEVVRDPGARRMAEVMDGIRKKIEAPPTPKEVNLSVEPSKLDFGQIEPGDATSSQTVNVRTDIDRGVRVTLSNYANEGISIVEPTGSVAVKAGENYPLEIQLRSAEGMTDGLRTLTLAITPEASTPNEVIKTVNVEAALNVVRVPLWRKLLKYLVLLLIVLAITVAIASLIKGEPPWIWLPGLVKRAGLEGEIEIIQPRPLRPEDEFISLTQRGENKILLSSLIPKGTTVPGDSADAELSLVKQKGRLRVRLRKTHGIVRVNNVGIADVFVYNEDKIELEGDGLAKQEFRFHCLDQQRPEEFEGEL